MNKIIYFMIAFAFCFQSIAPLRAESSKPMIDQSNPLNIIQSIYGFYPKNTPIEVWHTAKLMVDQNDLPYASIFKNIYDLLMIKHNTDKDGGPCIDVNLVCNCQDGVPEFYRIKIIGKPSKTTRQYRVDLKGKDFSLRQIFWSLKKVNGSWFVEDLGFASRKDSIYRYMNACLNSIPHGNFSR